MKFYLCSLPLCLFLVLAIFSSGSDGQMPVNYQWKDQKPIHRPYQVPMKRPYQVPNQRPHQVPNQRLYQVPNQKPNRRLNQKFNKNHPIRCHLKGKTFRIGAIIASNCRICICRPNGQTECVKMSCLHCHKYLALISSPCCTGKCRGMRPQKRGGFEFEADTFDDDTLDGDILDGDTFDKETFENDSQVEEKPHLLEMSEETE